MINGKFFTGLPERMMKRTNGPDRQRSHLFWPDEEQIVPATENKKVLKGNGRSTQNNYATVDQLTHDPDESSIEPKELFKKQLTSKIEFYDMVDTPKIGKRSPYKAEKINTNIYANNEQPINNKKHETFSSKIEFYDFADDQPQQTPPKMDRNSKVEVEKYSQNSPKLYEKRITFIDNKANNNVQKPKSILKNTDIVVEKPKGVAKNTKKKNLSKSVENLARSKSAPNIPKENFEVIENDVSNISLNNNISDRVDIDKQTTKQNVREHRIEIQQEAYENGFDEREPGERYEPVMITPPSRRQTREVREEYEDRNDNGIVSSNHSRRTRVYDEPDFVPDPYVTSRRITRPTPPQRGDDQQARNNRTREIYHKIHNEDHYPYDVSQNDFGDAPILNNKTSRYRSSPEVEEHIRQPSRTTPQQQQPTQRAHRHLVSNISFGSADTDHNSSTGQRRLVRNAAVTRVSVGLPD